MKPIELLEHLATHAHHRVDFERLIEMQSKQIQNAFYRNNPLELKKQLGDSTDLADRSTIFSM